MSKHVAHTYYIEVEQAEKNYFGLAT